jgi:phosphohistidine phosphatase
VAIVGHQPWLSDVLAWLVGAPRDGAEARFPLRKGAVARLEGAPEPGAMSLTALFQPRDLRACARARSR